jgi:hypothetical protein
MADKNFKGKKFPQRPSCDFSLKVLKEFKELSVGMSKNNL